MTPFDFRVLKPLGENGQNGNQKNETAKTVYFYAVTTVHFCVDISNQLAGLLKNNPQALGSFPEAQAIIQFEVAQIGTMAANVSPGIYGIDNNYSFALDPTTLLKGIKAKDAASLTHISSNNICEQGGKDCTL